MIKKKRTIHPAGPVRVRRAGVVYPDDPVGLEYRLEPFQQTLGLSPDRVLPDLGCFPLQLVAADCLLPPDALGDPDDDDRLGPAVTLYLLLALPGPCQGRSFGPGAGAG